jgi:hypothetical protein
MPSLTPEQQDQWLEQHIKTRICAALASVSLVRRMQESLPLSSNSERTQLEFVFHAVWEGRQAALRWLIEFLGVAQGRDGKPKAPAIQSDDVRITDLAGGVPLSISSSEAAELAVMWHAVSKATSHATQGSGHAPIDDIRLERVNRIIIEHLRKTVYSAAGKIF